MSNLHAPFHYDYVGSFLRPGLLKQARLDYEKKKISKEELTQVENECITHLVYKLKALGYHVITDGEFRRQAWHLDFMWGFNGVSHQKTINGLTFHGEQALIDDTFLNGKISLEDMHPFVHHYEFMKQFEDVNTIVKQTIPSPAQTLAQFWMPFARENTLKYYENVEDLCRDIVDAYKKVIQQLYNAGCRNLQFDDCTWGMMADRNAYLYFGTKPDDIECVKNRHVQINNEVLDCKPQDMVINTHICRGNYHSTYANSGPYDRVADPLFTSENVDAYYLEFDDERSGGFAPLLKVSDNKKVVLGLITTKNGELEDKDKINQRIHEATQYIPLERLCLSPQCGFASCEIGNKLSEQQQWDKLKLVKEIALQVWGE